MADQCKYQIQLLSRIDGYRLAFQDQGSLSSSEGNDVKPTDIHFLHFLLSMENPQSNSTYKPLADLSVSADLNIKSLMKKLEKLREKIPSDKKSLSKFVKSNLSDLSICYPFILSGKSETNVGKLIDFLNNLNENVNQIVEKTESLQVIYTPSQITGHLSLKIPKIVDKLNQLLSDEKNGLESVSGLVYTFTQTLLDIQKAIAKNTQFDLLNYTLNDSDFVNYRKQIADFCFYCGFIDQNGENSIAQSISEILSFFDYLLGFRNSMPQSNTNVTPLSISKAASLAKTSIQTILSSSSNPTIIVIEEPLIAIASLYDDISIAFEEPVCLKPTATRLVQFFQETHNDFEAILRKLIGEGYNVESHNFLIAFYQIIISLNKLEFDEHMISIVKVSTVINEPIRVANEVVETKENIDSILVDKPKSFEIAELALLFINPSRKAKSTEGNALSLSNEELLSQINEIADSITKLDIADPLVVESLVMLSKKLSLLGKTVDEAKSDDNTDISKKYNEVVKSLNNKVYMIIDEKCQPVDSMTAFSASRSIKSLLETAQKMLDIAENSEVDPKKDRKKIKAISKDFSELVSSFNESLLIEHAEKITKYIEDLSTILGKSAEKYDRASRDCYFANAIEFTIALLTVINSLTSQMEAKAYDLSEVLSDIDAADSSLRDIISILAYKDSSIANKIMLKFISRQLDTISLIRQALTIAIPQQLVRPIVEYRAQLDSLPALSFAFGGNIAQSSIGALNSLSLARWKLCHLTEYYLYDQELKAILKDVTSQLLSAQKEVDDENFKGNYTNMLKTVDNIYSILGEYNERTGDEPTDYIDIFKTLIQQITKTWQREITKDAGPSMESARKRLNDAIRLLHGDLVKLEPFVDPVEQFGDSFLVPYLAASASRYGGDEFFKAAMDAKGIDFPSGNDKLKKGMEIMNSFINITTISPDEIQQKIAAPMIYYVAAGKLMAYKQYPEFLELAIAFMEAAPHELNNICFALSYHFHRIYEKCAPNTIKSKDTIAQLLKVNYMQHSNSKLADTAYYTAVFATIIPKEHSPIFSVLAEPLRGCFHCRMQVSTVDFKEAIAYLNGIVPTQSRLQELKGIEARQKEEEVIIPLSTRNKNATDDDDAFMNENGEFDDQHMSQDMIITRDVQVIEPKKIASIASTPSFQALLSPTGSIIGGSILVSGSSILAALEDQNQLPHNGRIFEPSGTEITIPNEAANGPKTWQTIILPTRKENATFPNRDSYYKDIWNNKPLASNELSVRFFDYERDTFSLKKYKQENEYNLPEEDINSPENFIKTPLIGELMREISSCTKKPNLTFSPLGNTFKCEFTPKNFNKQKIWFADGNRERKFEVPEKIPAALKKLKKAKEGEIVAPIKQDKSTHEELLKSSIFAVSRFLDVFSAYNIEALVNFLSLFERAELDPILLPWIYNNFSPKHYPKHFLSRFLTSVATYSRQIFLDRSDNAEIANTLKALPYLLRIANVTMMCYSAKDPETRVFANTKAASAIHDFIDAISFVISCVSSYQISREINRQLLIFMVIVAPSSHELAFLAAYNMYLRNLNNCQKINLIGSFAISPFSPELMAAKFQLSSLMYFAPQKEFVLAMSSCNERTLDSIFTNAAPLIFSSNIQKYIVNLITTIAEIAKIVETFSEIANEYSNSNNNNSNSNLLHNNENNDEEDMQYLKDATVMIADLFLLYIKVAISNFQNVYVRNFPSLTEQLLVPVLLAMHSSPKENMVSFFSQELSEAEQVKFFNYLYNTMVSLLTVGGSPNPFDKIPDFMTRNDHLSYLQNLRSKTTNVNYTLYTEFTLRIIEFINYYLTTRQLSHQVVDSASQCIVSLMNSHQSSDNYAHCLILVAQYVECHAEIFFKYNVNAYYTIVTYAYQLVAQELQVARSSGVALLVHLMYADFMVTQNLIVSGLYVMDRQQNFLLSCPKTKVGLYNNLVIQLDLFTYSFSIKEFVKKSQALISSLKTVNRLINDKISTKQSQEFQYELMMKIADEFLHIPNQRIRWLSEIVNFNKKQGLFAQAFKAQMRVAALISRVLTLLGQDIPYSIEIPDDIRETENEVYIDKENEIKKIYYDSSDFTVEGLHRTFFNAMNYAYNGCLVSQYATIAASLGVRDLKPFANVVTPQYFYLLGTRTEGKTSALKIYSTTISSIDGFLDYLLDENVGRYPFKIKINAFDSIVQAENNLKNGRFAIPLNSEKLVEFEGESNTFYSDHKVPTDSWTAISVTRTFFKSFVPLPNDCICVDAKKSVMRRITKKDLLVSKVKMATDFLMSSRSITKNLKGTVGVAALSHSLEAVFLNEENFAKDMLTAHHSGFNETQKFAISLVQDVSETMNLYAEKVRLVQNVTEGIEHYRKISSAADLFISRLHITGFEFEKL